MKYKSEKKREKNRFGSEKLEGIQGFLSYEASLNLK